MSPTHNPKYWIEKRAQRKSGYPLATIAYYGPDASVASKVVVGIMLSDKDDQVADLRKWFADAADVRLDLDINQQILEFIERHRVHRVATVSRIIGCPHEEGVDYPEGESCLQCPYSANRDRWTGELISDH